MVITFDNCISSVLIQNHFADVRNMVNKTQNIKLITNQAIDTNCCYKK